MLRRPVVVIGLGVLIGGIALTPAISGSFLTKKRATKVFLKKSAIDTAVASSPAGGFGSTSTTPVSIPGASASVTVPRRRSAILVAEFSGVLVCSASSAGFSCPIEIKVDGADANPPPEPGVGYRFDSSGDVDLFKARSMTVSKQVGAGKHTVTVRYLGNTSGGTSVNMRSWHLLVQSFPP
jgi:hypothetical protein